MHFSIRSIVSFLILLCLVSFQSACTSSSASIPWKGAERIGPLPAIAQLDPLPLNECSGMAVSGEVDRKMVWTLNDSGGWSRLIGFRYPETDSITWGEEYFQLFIENGENIDWEDLMMDANGMLWVGDTGNNSKQRKQLTLYRIAVPETVQFAQSVVPEIFKFEYENPDGSQKPLRRDCEAICQWGNGVLLFTKRMSSRRCEVFFLPNIIDQKPTEQVLKAKRLFQIDNFWGVTAADSQLVNGKWKLALLGYRGLWVWEATSDPVSLMESLQSGVGFKFRAGLCETVHFESLEQLIITNESRDVFRIPLNEI